MTDAELLRRYAEERSEAAFAELVTRYLALVYSTALRRTNGDPHAAADVSQTVFVALARQAAALQRHPLLAGWLHVATRNAAHNAMREAQRRHARDQEAYAMQNLNATPPEIPGESREWADVRPVLDAALDELNDRDRHAIVLRFFRAQPFAQIGAALGVREDAVRMRVDRALEKLRLALARRGVTSTGAALGVMLAHHSAAAVPAGLAASVMGAALAASAGTAVASGAVAALVHFMNTKTAAGIAGVMLAVVIGGAVWETRARRQAEERLADAQTVARRPAAGAVALSPLAAVASQPVAASRPAAKSLAGRSAAAVTADAAVEVFLEKYPEVRQIADEHIRAAVRERYAAFLYGRGLSPDQTERFIYFAALRTGSGVRLTPWDRAALQYTPREGRAAAIPELKSLLGEKGYEEFIGFSNAREAVPLSSELAAALYRTEAPLSAAQAQEMLRIFRERRGLDETRLQVLDWNGIMADAGQVLAPAQLAPLEQMRDREVAELQRMKWHEAKSATSQAR